MKNLKLLLATTAILAASTMAANAYEYSTDMNVHVRVVSPAGITKTQDVDFGTVVKNSSYNFVNMSPTTGIVYINNENEPASQEAYGTFFGKTTNGLFSIGWRDESMLGGGESSVSLNYENSVLLKNANGGSITYEPNVVKIGSQAIGAGDEFLDDYAVGGKLTGLSSAQAGDYTGQLTITFVYTLEEPELP